MPNASVMAGEFDELLYWKEQLRHGVHAKKTKEYILAKMLEAAKKVGEDIPDYNSTAFFDWLVKGSEL